MEKLTPGIYGKYAKCRDWSLNEVKEALYRVELDLGLAKGQGGGLSDRCALSCLIAGRSRPYIRDELVISLNTVHAHARNIFSKCNVHSQQELIDLAQSSGQGELS